MLKNVLSIVVKSEIKCLTRLKQSNSWCLLTTWRYSPVVGPVSVHFHTSRRHFEKKKDDKNVMVFKDFSEATDRTRNTFLEMVNTDFCR